MVSSVFVWNKIIPKDEKKEETNPIDVSDANNVPSIDAKLGTDIRITTGYLLNYTTKKSGIWYMSSGYIKTIKANKEETTLTISEDKDSSNTLEAIISQNINLKKGTTIYFVGNIDLSNGQLKLSTIDQTPINFKNVTEISFNDLYNNITLLSKTTFTISGYMITDNDTYKLFDSKTTYQNNNYPGNYFLINWRDSFNLTGNDNVKITCSLKGTYELADCILQ